MGFLERIYDKSPIVNEIPRESSGKFRMIVNTVDC